jgi:hypothetical protein
MDRSDAKAGAAMRLKIDLNGDRRLTEKVILEVKAAARRFGFDIADVEVLRQGSTSRKAGKAASRRTLRDRA